MRARDALPIGNDQDPGKDLVFPPESIPPEGTPETRPLLQRLGAKETLSYGTQLEALASIREINREYLARRKDIHPNIQLRLACSRIVRTRVLLAGNKRISEETQKVLAKDKNKEVRHELIDRNGKKLAYDVWAILATSPRKTTRQKVANNLHTPEELRVLAGLSE